MVISRVKQPRLALQIGLVIFLLFCTPVSSLSAKGTELPARAGVGDIELRVVNVEVVKKIKSLTRSFESKDKEYQIIVVTLEGVVAEPCRIIFRPADFGALAYYEGKDNTNTEDEDERDFGISVANAVRVNDLVWTIQSRKERNVTIYYLREPGPVKIEVGFNLPKKTKECEICYPTAIREKVILSSSGPEQD